MAANFKKDEILIESGTNELGIMEFTICDRHFGINIAKVKEIIAINKYPVTPMPNSNPYVEGVFKPREEYMTVINLAAYMGLPGSDDSQRDIFIITSFNRLLTAFHVHNVVGIHKVSWSSIEKPDRTIYGGEEGLATGITTIDEKVITIIDFEKIIYDISPQNDLGGSSKLGERNKSYKPIMVVDDSPFLEKMVIDALEKAGYVNLICCTNGAEAWNKLNEFKKTGLSVKDQISLILTDIEMPQMDGHRLLKLIKGDPDLSVIPVIIFSSLINDDMRAAGNKLGAAAQLSKPEINDLVPLIDKYIL